MSKKAVLITGAARRVGAAIALHFAERGYDIALHYRSSHKEAQAVKKDIEKNGVRCVLFKHDLQNIKETPAFMKKVKQALPHCQVLINNASAFEPSVLMKTTEASFDRHFDTNFKAPFFLTQAFVKSFGKGCVINILDTDIVDTYGSYFAYQLSKRTLAEFTIMAARELGPKVRVNGVCPGYVLPSSKKDKFYIDKVKKMLPLRDFGKPEHVAEACCWLSEQKYITGEIIFVDGGKHVL